MFPSISSQRVELSEIQQSMVEDVKIDVEICGGWIQHPQNISYPYSRGSFLVTLGKDLRNCCKACEKAGLLVFGDLVFNHMQAGFFSGLRLGKWWKFGSFGQTNPP